MNISELKPGMELKSYARLCDVLGITAKKGNSRNAQRKEIERFVKLSKGKGYRLIVDEVYNKPKPKEDGRGNVYGDLIQMLIADMVIESKDEYVLIGRGQLQREINMANQNYSFCNENRPKFSKYLNMDIMYIHDFFNTTNSNFKAMIDTALDNLVDRSVINYTYVHAIYTKDGMHRQATDEEATLIHDRQKELLHEMGYEKVSEVMYTKDWKDFKETLKFTLQKEENFNINYTYMSYRIIKGSYLEDEQQKMLLQYLDSTKRKEHRNELNTLLLARLLDNALNRQRKALDGKSNTKNERLLKSRKDLALKRNTKIIMSYVIDKENKANVEEEIKIQQDENLKKKIQRLDNQGFFPDKKSGK